MWKASAIKVVVNGGSNIVLGTTNPKTFTIAVTATDDSGIKEDYTFPVLWHGPGQKMPDDPYGWLSPTTCPVTAWLTAPPRPPAPSP
jgi:hypothetical protein